MSKIVIYTDGSSRGNPGPGGWGAILMGTLRQTHGDFGNYVSEIGSREEKTTNNRMEMTAAIESLKNIPENSEIEIDTDSEYLMKGMTMWIHSWQRNNWRTKDNKDVLNKDLWLKLLEVSENKNIEWKKVLGHSGHALNDRCDEIATSFADGKKIDLYDGPREGYKFNES